MKEVQVALYARVSSEQQAEAKTIDSQLSEIRTWIVPDGFELTDVLNLWILATVARPLSGQHWSDCVMLRLVGWIGSMCIVPIGLLVTMPDLGALTR